MSKRFRADDDLPIPETVAGCRTLYARIRARSEARTPAIFDKAVGSHVACPADADALTRARAWVKAALVMRFTCGRCAGTGQFVTYVENGVPKGPGGECYRCDGRGAQNDGQVRRNEAYDRFAFARAAHAMMAE